jgi:hypothetical protein
MEFNSTFAILFKPNVKRDCWHLTEKSCRGSIILHFTVSTYQNKWHIRIFNFLKVYLVQLYFISWIFLNNGLTPERMLIQTLIGRVLFYLFDTFFRITYHLIFINKSAIDFDFILDNFVDASFFFSHNEDHW